MSLNLVKVQIVVDLDFSYQNYMISSYQLFVVDLGINFSKVDMHFLQIKVNFTARIFLVKA